MRELVVSAPAGVINFHLPSVPDPIGTRNVSSTAARHKQTHFDSLTLPFSSFLMLLLLLPRRKRIFMLFRMFKQMNYYLIFNILYERARRLS